MFDVVMVLARTVHVSCTDTIHVSCIVPGQKLFRNPVRSYEENLLRRIRTNATAKRSDEFWLDSQSALKGKKHHRTLEGS